MKKTSKLGTNHKTVKFTRLNFHHREWFHDDEFLVQKKGEKIHRKKISIVGLAEGSLIKLFSWIQIVFVCLSILPACLEVKVNQISRAANLLPSPTGPNEPKLRQPAVEINMHFRSVLSTLTPCNRHEGSSSKTVMFMIWVRACSNVPL